MHTIRKPRVFLSHSKKDIEFVRRLEADLRGAQCEPWIDDVELRPGRPWLEQIFSAGIPSCEIVFCYFTANSAQSEVFMQELDARLIERLQSSRVALLLYVSSSDLRKSMRLDLQRLQVPEMNDVNYASAFPRLVAEIWRSYAEILVQGSIETEKVRRLEAELRIKELEGEATESIFTVSEQAEFKSIWARLNRKTSLIATVAPLERSQTGGIGDIGGGADQAMPAGAEKHLFVLDLGSLFRSSLICQKYQPSTYPLHDKVSVDLCERLGVDQNASKVLFDLPLDIEAELLKFGFVQRQYAATPPDASRVTRIMHSSVKLIFTPKFDRFGFWLEHNLGVFSPTCTVMLSDA